MRIFITIPFSIEFEDIYLSIRQATEYLGHELVRADNVFSSGLITDQILNEIRNSNLVIADISSRDPNVMYEIGFAQSSNIPILPICQRGNHILFDIPSIRIILYDRERLNETLLKPLRNSLSHTDFNVYINKEIKEYQKEKKKIKTVFVSYSHVDATYLDRLKIHLKPFEKNGLIDLWEDTKIKAGEKWKEKIENALERSAIAILLVSADFLASDFIIDNELPPLLKAAEENGKVILPVIVKPCRFTKMHQLSQFQSINDPKMPLSKLDENGKEELYVEIANYIDDSL